MAGESCSLSCNVKDSQGRVKVSTLWKELEKFFKGDRRQAITHYFLTKDDNFLRENSDILEFDVDGEVTISSLKKALERNGKYSDLSDALVLAELNKEMARELKANRVDYSEALDNVLKFNKSNQFRDGFMATLTREEDGRYSVEVVERNPLSEDALAGQVQNKILTDAVRMILEDKGLSVDFLNNAKYAVKYSTNNVQLNADGLYAVASILDGRNTSSEIAEVAGHFIVASMEGNPLVERLVNILTPEVQQAIFKNPESQLVRENFIVSDNSAREAAGILIGKQLLAPFTEAQKGAWYTPANTVAYTVQGIKSILKRIGNLVKRLFGIYKPDEVQKLVQQAKDAASTAAQGFITDVDMANTYKAVFNPVTYTSEVSASKHLSEEVRRNVRAYYDTLDNLKGIVSQLRSSIGRASDPTNKEIFKKLKQFTQTVASEYNPRMSVELFAERSSIEGMVVILEGITQVLDTDVRTLLDQIQPSDKATSYNNIVPNARNLRTVSTTLKNVAQLHQTLSEKLGSLKASESINYRDANDNLVVETLSEALKRLGDVLLGNEETYINSKNNDQVEHGLVRIMELKRRQVFLDAMAEFYGKDYIDRNAGIIWIQKGWKHKLVRSDKIEGYRYKSIQDMIASLEEDISWFDRYLSSVADCGDLASSIANKVVKQANMEADRTAAKFWDRIEEVRLQMQDVFGTTDWTPLLEVIVDAEGRRTKTGNFVSQVNYGAWEQARAEFKEQLKREFNNHLVELKAKAYENNKDNPNYVFAPSDEQLAVLYHNFVDPLWQKWHQENSDEDKTAFKGKRYIPKTSKYHNTQWDELFDFNNPGLTKEEADAKRRRLKWYNTFMELKDDMDGLLPKNSTVRWRAPQIIGRFSHKYRSLRAQMENSRAAFGHAMRMNAQYWFIVKPEDAWMFGSNNEFNEIEEDPMESEIFFEKDKINRLPMFGINKLHDMNQLSTDIFGTMLQYGSMAATYNAMESVVDIFELGKEVLKERDEAWKIKNNKNKESRAYERYIKFVEKNIYGINVEAPSFDRKGTWRKIANGLSSIGGRILLWGNLHGGIVNTGTGMFEIFKEACAGENFNHKEVMQAHKMYFDGLLKTMGLGLIDAQRPDDKNSLWIRHWNILSENRSFLHNQRFDNKALSLLDNRLWDWFGHTMMLPYSSGDHYMQTIPYYAMGIREKVYDINGKKMNLIDAYDIVDGQEVFAIESQLGDDALGRTPKKLQLKQGIFRSVQDIADYKTVQSILTKMADFFDAHPGIRGDISIAQDMLSEEEKRYLTDEGLAIPMNVKQLETLRTTLNSKAIDLTFNSADESAFMDKCRNICNRLHGIYNSEDKVAFQQNMYGNLVMALRGYALGMVNRRYADSRFNISQDKQVEGSYNTLSKVMLSAFYNINNMDNWKAVGESLLLTVPVGNLLLFSDKYGDKVKADMVRAGYSPHQYYNMRRAGADFMVLETLALLNLLSAPGKHFGLGSEDEDKNNKVDTSDNFWAGLLYYFTMRWFNEQAAFTTLGGMWKESTSLLDYIPVGFSGAKMLLWDIAKLMVDTQIDKIGGRDLENSDLYYQGTKEGKYKKGDAKWWVKFKRLAPYVRSWYVITHPYDAASSYEYGRRVRGK